MALKLAFIGYDRQQTQRYFEELYRENIKQTALINLSRGVLILRDGTIIHRINGMDDIQGRRFDQIILADDRRMKALFTRSNEIAALECNSMCSPVPEDFRKIIYDTDWRGEDD